MLELFERAIADGAGPERLEHIRDQLRQGVDADRLRRLEQIENDYQAARLIQFGLQQDRGSIPFSVAAGFRRWFRKKYPDAGDLAAEMMRDLRREMYMERSKKKLKGVTNHEGNGRGAADPGDERAGQGGPERIYEAIPSEEPGTRPTVELQLLDEESGSDGPG